MKGVLDLKCKHVSSRDVWSSTVSYDLSGPRSSGRGRWGHQRHASSRRHHSFISAAATWTLPHIPSSSAFTRADSAAVSSSHPGRPRPLAVYLASTPKRVPVRCAAYGRRGSGGSGSEPNYYELLGLDPDCEEEDIRAAFRRRAKELHPDVNKGEGATEAFVQLSRAYEVLSDAEARRQYDIAHSTRRLNFFRDIVEDDDDDIRRSPFRWSHMDRRPSGLRPDEQDRDDDDVRRRPERGGGSDGADDEDEEEDEEQEEGPGWRRRRSQEEILEELAKFMSGPGSLRAWQSGRLDPWGTSTSDSWFRQVERQTRNPYGPTRPGYGSSRDDDDDGFGGRGSEWDPSRRVPGWSPPGRGSEWSHPRRQWDDEDQRGGGPGRQGGGGGGGGDFRRPFKI